jgi:hypothetical protein
VVWTNKQCALDAHVLGVGIHKPARTKKNTCISYIKKMYALPKEITDDQMQPHSVCMWSRHGGCQVTKPICPPCAWSHFSAECRGWSCHWTCLSRLPAVSAVTQRQKSIFMIIARDGNNKLLPLKTPQPHASQPTKRATGVVPTWPGQQQSTARWTAAKTAPHGAVGLSSCWWDGRGARMAGGRCQCQPAIAAARPTPLSLRALGCDPA